MTFNYCDHCKEVTEGIPEDIDIKGTATESDLELPGHNEAEIHILLPGDVSVKSRTPVPQEPLEVIFS